MFVQNRLHCHLVMRCAPTSSWKYFPLHAVTQIGPPKIAPKYRQLLGRPTRKGDDNIKTIFKKQDEGLDWIDLAQDKDKWRALVKNVGEF